MSAVYRNNGYLATDCPACGQEVRVDRRGEEFTFTCRGGHSDLEVRAGLPPEVMLELAAASRQRPRHDTAVATGKVPGPAVDTAELLDEVRMFVRRFVVLPTDGTGDLIALWVLHTHAIGAAWASPYLRVTSAAPDSGKTLLLEILAVVCRRGWHAVNPSSAVLYRKVDRDTPTLLLDEMDNFPIEDRRDALAILNTGYKRGATVDRCKENGDLQSFVAYCPKAYAGLDVSSIVPALLSRSITIRMEKKISTERVDMWIAPLVEPEAIRLRERCEAWADQHTEALTEHQPDLLGLINRAAEVWWALLAIAEVAGEDWHARAKAAVKEFTTGGDDTDDVPAPVQLLLDIRDAFGDRAGDVHEGSARGPQSAGRVPMGRSSQGRGPRRPRPRAHAPALQDQVEDGQGPRRDGQGLPPRPVRGCLRQAPPRRVTSVTTVTTRISARAGCDGCDGCDG